MTPWRRRLGCGVAAFLLASAAASAQISVALVDGEVEVRGVSPEALDGRSAEDVVRVLVARDSPAVLGDYRLDGATIRFRPMFPFDPGREYLVRVAVGEEPLFATVRLPARDIEPSTVVTAIFPTSDVLPENQLKLYVHFSAPMAGGDGLPFVKLLDENGHEVVDPFLPLGDAFWDREMRRYTVFFDPGRVKQGILPNEQMGRPILEGKRYTLVIDREWRDAQGLPLASGHRKQIIAGPPDETPIDPKRWRVHAPRAGTRDVLVVDFGEPLDRAVLLRALTVDGVDGSAETAENETRWVFTPAEAWSAGTYELVALALLEDLAGNQIGKPFEVDVFDRIDSPDDVPETHRIPFAVRD